MTTVIIAVSDTTLPIACRRQLAAAGHAAIEIDRPLSLLSLARRLHWDALCVDDSDLGRSTLGVARAAIHDSAIIGLGFKAFGATRSIPLPLTATDLIAAIAAGRIAQPAPPQAPVLRLDPAGHRVLVGDAEVHLSVTEYRLLALLVERSPREVGLDEALRVLWGHSSVGAGLNALRVHIRNLRARLAGAGLRNAVQSRRGRGYALVLS